jgi:hypothetical protein
VHNADPQRCPACGELSITALFATGAIAFAATRF